MPPILSAGNLNATAACVLGLLAIGPPPGHRRRSGAISAYDVAATAEASLGRFFTLTRSQIYRELTALAEAGLVAAIPAPQGRVSATYRLTASGREKFQDWITAVAAGPARDDQLRSHLMLIVFFGRWVPEIELIHALRAHQARLRSTLEPLYHIRDALADEDSLPAQVLAWGIANGELQLRWLGELLHRYPGV